MKNGWEKTDGEGKKGEGFREENKGKDSTVQEPGPPSWANYDEKCKKSRGTFQRKERLQGKRMGKKRMSVKKERKKPSSACRSQGGSGK